MSDIVTFLLARISEDEAAARASAAHQPVYPHYGDDAHEETWMMATNEGTSMVAAEHIKRWPPARVLAECAAKRAIIALHYPSGEGYLKNLPDNPTWWDACVVCQWDIDCNSPKHDDQYEPGQATEFPCDTLRSLASVYSDHPDFDSSWGVSE